jgi:hypothetical protein
MDQQMLGMVLKRLEEPDEVRQMVKGKFEIVHTGVSGGE